MIYLVDYDRGRGTLVSIEAFAADELRRVQDKRLALELELLRRGIEREVVILEAPSEEALRRTHGRCFGSLDELARIA